MQTQRYLWIEEGYALPRILTPGSDPNLPPRRQLRQDPKSYSWHISLQRGSTNVSTAACGAKIAIRKLRSLCLR